ncbi:hypothetical protein WH87_04340 [Devosia epidermidihirudinis]|uniref:N-acetyltransferase domain-containing protein n=1 Tax=Devosia epidermidihirudinis TaxID=1293439 RepID=A0A0F5QGN9_9HYPH|nr:GNAT family N-acetyltransferase [Devosia epidermidihirudinis]KKC39878.1 hypothetical protein WH87_04340 [Devosia epidermidihirudinis]
MIIRNLRDAPEHTADVADRIWQAWWRPAGAALEDVNAALADVVAAEAFPFTLVSVTEGVFSGTVTAVASDLDARPDLGPWIAALWVEPDCRGQGIAEALAAAALERLVELGYDLVYLCAKPKMRAYYATRGWQVQEQDVGTDGLDVFVRHLGTTASLAPMPSP